MHKKYNKFLVISFAIVLVLGVYSYFYNDFVGSVYSADSSLTSSLGTNAPIGTSDTSQQAADDTAFLMKLKSLTVIKVDTSLLKQQGFMLLVDNNIPLEPALYGRTNPFSPTSNSSVSNLPTFTVKSNSVSAITNKTAVLNGVLEGSTSDNVYFEYGTTNALGKITPKTSTSLIGNFSAVLSGLTSKTTYYYHAVANVNGIIVFGDLLTFTTN